MRCGVIEEMETDMDQARFDGIARHVGTITRRTLAGTMALGGLSALLGSTFVVSDVNAGGKRGKNRKNKNAKQQLPPPPPPGCVPNCTDRTCGKDGCGGSCGTCDGSQACIAGACCVPEAKGDTCAGRCGTWINNCGQPVACKTCSMGQICLSNGSCAVECAANNDCSGGSGCSNPSIEGKHHCITGPLMPFEACKRTSDCPPGSHCQDIGNGGACIALHI